MQNRTSHELHVERLAELAVSLGANVQPGQVVAVTAELGKEALTRAIAASAYRHGASFVEVSYADPHLKRARVLNADPATLDVVPSWAAHRMLELGRQRCARIALSGPVEPHLLEDLDQSLVGRERSGPLKEAGEVMAARSTNWTIVPAPTAGWAALVHPELEPEAALERLWSEIVHVCRLNEADPVAAWHQRMGELEAASTAMAARRFDALRFVGPGTDLTVGLLPTSKWLYVRFETADGLRHMPNIPGEEIFTTPDPSRTDGVVRSTKPLVVGGTIVEGLEVEFRDGRAIRIDADKGAEALRSLAARDEGASRLGEVALVDGHGRIGELGTIFYDTLLDENAASHLALGRGFPFAVDEADADRVNTSEIHIDFMIGSPEVNVMGITSGGEEIPALIGGRWQL